MDDRLVRHALGFWHVREPPTAEQLHDYYRNRYYQGEHGNYRKKYSAEEVAWFSCQTARVVAAAVAAGAPDRGRALVSGAGKASRWHGSRTTIGTLMVSITASSA